MKRKHGILLGFAVFVMAMMFTFATLVAAGPFNWDGVPDAYTHATSPTSKAILYGEDLENALQFLVDSSHYLYIDRATPWHGNFHRWPDTGFDTDWRSPVNGRVYRGPFNDPITRSVNWMSINPNGSVNNSVGSYWAVIPPNADLDLPHNEIQGFSTSPEWQIITSMAPGQSVNNYIERERGTFAIDAALLSHYGLPSGWQDRNQLYVEVRLRNYELRVVTPQQFYDGYLPTTTGWGVPARWRAVPGWGVDYGDDQFRTPAQFWGVATGAAAALNFYTDEERAAYIERANADPGVAEALTGGIVDLHFYIMQIVHVRQENGFDFEQASGKVNGINRSGDGFLDRFPEGHERAGEHILQNGYDMHLLPLWAYDLNFNLGWWVDGFGAGAPLINAQGRVIIGANPDGTYILED